MPKIKKEKQIAAAKAEYEAAKAKLKKLGVSPESDSEDEESDGTVEIPSAAEVKKASVAKLQKAAKSIKLNTKGVSEKSLRALLTTVANVVSGDTDEID